MNRNDINDVRKVDQEIMCNKKRLTLPGDGLIIQGKRKIETMSEKAIPRKKYKPLGKRKKAFGKGREKSGNYEVVLQSQDIYRQRS